MSSRTPGLETNVFLRAAIPSKDSGEQWSGRLSVVDGDHLTIAAVALPNPDRLQTAAKASGLEMTWQGDQSTEYTLPVSLDRVDARTGEVTVKIGERRDHMRVDSSLIFRHRTLSDAEYAALAPRILSQPLEYLEDGADNERSTGGDEVWDRLDNVLANFYQMLRDLSDKVEHVIALQEGNEPVRRLDATSRVINISGSGLAFESADKIPVGAKLRMAFDLSRYPYREIICLGQVVRQTTHPNPSPDTPPHTVSVDFTHIREEDRDRIIHYVFRMQRRMLRNRRGQDH
jgi:hypothetical protein